MLQSCSSQASYCYEPLVPRVLVTPAVKLFLLLLYSCNFATVMQQNVAKKKKKVICFLIIFWGLGLTGSQLLALD